MKRFIVGTILMAGLAVSPPLASAAVQDWPVVGQVIRVGTCVVGGTGSLIASLLRHLTSWGSELVTTVGQCAIHTTAETTDVVEDVVAITIPSPDPIPSDVTVETPHE